LPQASRRPRSPSGRGSCSRRRCSRGRCSLRRAASPSARSGGAALSVVGAVVGGLAAFALARTAGRTQHEATVMRRAKLRKVHALLERRGFLAMLAARLMTGVPATGFTTSPALLPSGYLRLPRRWRSAPWCGRPHMPCSARGSAGVARHDPDRRSIDRGRCGDGRGPGATFPNCRCRDLSFASASRKSKAAAALLRDRCLPSVSR
jgi:VTT domain